MSRTRGKSENKKSTPQLDIKIFNTHMSFGFFFQFCFKLVNILSICIQSMKKNKEPFWYPVQPVQPVRPIKLSASSLAVRVFTGPWRDIVVA